MMMTMIKQIQICICNETATIEMQIWKNKFKEIYILSRSKVDPYVTFKFVMKHISA
jgi:hypothetical protein